MGKELSTQGTLNSYELSNNKSAIYLWMHQVIDGVKTTKFATFENLVNAVYSLLSDAFTPETPETSLVGEIKLWSAATAPDKWLLCDGAAISRTTYADLFELISTTYGAGDGTTTFNIPDLRGRAPMGAGQGSGLSNRLLGSFWGEEEHLLSIIEMPNHNHNYTLPANSTRASGSSACVSTSSQQTKTTASEGGGEAHNNIQPSLVVNFIIYTGVSEL